MLYINHRTNKPSILDVSKFCTTYNLLLRLSNLSLADPFNGMDVENLKSHNGILFGFHKIPYKIVEDNALLPTCPPGSIGVKLEVDDGEYILYYDIDGILNIAKGRVLCKLSLNGWLSEDIEILELLLNGSITYEELVSGN